MKRSIKAVVAILVASMFAMSVTACGSGGDNSGSETKAADNAQEGVAEADDTKAGADVKGETYDLAQFTVLVPEGWVAQDFFDKTQVKMYKAKDISEAYAGVPSIDFEYREKGEYNLMTSVFDSYEDVPPVQLGAYTWEGVKAKDSSGRELFALHTTIGEGYMATSVWTKVNNTTISLDDPDVQAVFSSLTIK